MDTITLNLLTTFHFCHVEFIQLPAIWYSATDLISPTIKFTIPHDGRSESGTQYVWIFKKSENIKLPQKHLSVFSFYFQQLFFKG